MMAFEILAACLGICGIKTHFVCILLVLFHAFVYVWLNINLRFHPIVFSSPELKAQVSYSDRLLSVVRLPVRLSVNFYIFDFFSRTTGPILTKLGTNHP
jgi:uncharacterized membrane protein YphA (DoxX/SURF4 family)